ARGGVLVASDIFDIDALARKSGHRLLSKHVLANPGDEGNVAADAGGGHCLVRALAPGGSEKLSAQNGLARLRDALELDDHVGVGTADDENPGSGHGLSFRSFGWVHNGSLCFRS